MQDLTTENTEVTEKPFGHDVQFERRKRGGGYELHSVHRVGTRRRAERAAQLTTGFVAIVRVVPMTEEQYIAAFGWGKS